MYNIFKVKERIIDVMNQYAVEKLFGIEGLNIAWYGIIMGVALVLGYILASLRSKKYGMKSDVVIVFALIAIPLSIIGARLYFVAFKWDNYKDNLKSIFAINEGGNAIYGAVIGGVLAAIIFATWRKVSFLKLADLIVPSLVLGQAIGRWGNFINQEAFGEVVTNTKLQFFPYAVYIDNLKEWHQATFFYESMWCFVIFVALLLLSRKKVKTGILFFTYLASYGLGRVFIEGLRTDSLMLFNIRISQLLSGLLVLFGVVMIILFAKGILKSKDSPGKYDINSVEKPPKKNKKQDEIDKDNVDAEDENISDNVKTEIETKDEKDYESNLNDKERVQTIIEEDSNE